MACRCVRRWMADNFGSIMVSMFASVITAIVAIPFFQPRFYHAPIILLGLWALVLTVVIPNAVRGEWEKLDEDDHGD